MSEFKLGDEVVVTEVDSGDFYREDDYGVVVAIGFEGGVTSYLVNFLDNDNRTFFENGDYQVNNGEWLLYEYELDLYHG